MGDYDRYEGDSGAGFMMGLLAGTVLGAGLGMLLAPKAGSELRGAIGEQARHLGEQARHLSSRASEGYRRAAESAGTWAEKGREFVGRVRGAAEEEAGGFAGATAGSSPYGTSGTPGGTGPGGSAGFGGTTSATSGDFGRS